MSKATGKFIAILSIIAICLSVTNLYLIVNPKKDVQYVLYLGTNDKDTYEPVYVGDEAKQKVDEILTKHFSGWTISDARGGWTNEDGTISHEYSVVITLSDTTLNKVHEASNELIDVFRQSSILIQTNETKTEFYNGK